MYVGMLSNAGAGGTWTLVFQVATPDEPIIERVESLAFYERSGAKYKPARHIKAEGAFFQLRESEWLELTKGRDNYRFVSGPWTGPVDKKGFRMEWDRSCDVPTIPSRYASRAAGTVPTTYRLRRYRNDVYEYSYEYCVWADSSGWILLTASRYCPATGSPHAYSFSTYGVKLTPLDAEELPMGLGLCTIVHNSALPYEVSKELGDLTLPAIEQMHATNINQFEFLQDVNLVSQVFSLAKDVYTLNAGATLKDLASLYLSYSFGASSTYRDYVELGDSVAKEVARYSSASRYRDRRVHSRSSGTLDFLGQRWSARYNLTAYLDNFDQGIMGLMNTLDSWGFYPDRQAVWELVPFSFIVDWFVNVQDNLARRDAEYWREYYNVHACILTYKLETNWSYQNRNSTSLVGGSAHISLYNRSVERELPCPVVDWDVHLPSGVHQWVTGAALVIQKAGR